MCNNIKENFLWESEKINVEFRKNYILNIKLSEFYLCFDISCEIWHSFSRNPMSNIKSIDHNKCNLNYTGFCRLMILFCFEFILWVRKHKRIGREIISEIFSFKNPLVYTPTTSRVKHWIVDPFAKVKSAKHMVKSKKKNQSQIGGHFSVFLKQDR